MTKSPADRRPIIRLALSRTEVALSIGVSVSSVDQMVAEGALPPPRKWHSRKLWLVSELEACLNEWPHEGEQRNKVAPLDEWLASKQMPREGPGGYPIATDSDVWLKKYYDGLGFDPATMGREDMHRLHLAAQERWKQSIPVR